MSATATVEYLLGRYSIQLQHFEGNGTLKGVRGRRSFQKKKKAETWIVVFFCSQKQTHEILVGAGHCIWTGSCTGSIDILRVRRMGKTDFSGKIGEVWYSQGVRKGQTDLSRKTMGSIR